jgi:predicted DNA-binding protein YlxM (UPF0122 family)
MINEKYYLIMLFDFYGNLLTENQKNIFDLYCNYDLSLGEISESKKISRQAVYDSVKRSEKKLKNFEKKLKLVERFKIVKDSLGNFSELIIKIEKNLENPEKNITKKDIEELKNMVDKIVEIY